MSTLRPSVSCLLLALGAAAAAQSSPDGFPGFASTSTTLQPSGLQTDDHVGHSIAIDGDTLVVGTPKDNTKAKDAGAVHVFVRQGGTWTQQAELSGSDAAMNDFFGWSVDVSGDRLVVGARSKAGAGNPPQSGEAYVFVRSGSTWTEEAKLFESPPRAFAGFGTSVAIDGDRVVVGSPGGTAQTPIAEGHALVFVRSGGTWNLDATLRAPVPQFDDRLGVSVDVSGSSVAASAAGDDDQGSAAGAVYVWMPVSGSWALQQKLTASNGAANDQLGLGIPGRGIALDGDTLVAGSSTADPEGLTSAGAAWVFTRSGSSWTEEAQLVAADAAANDQFGISVGVRGDLVVVGAPFHDLSQAATDRGEVHAFARDAGAWNTVAMLQLPPPSTGPLGAAVDVDGTTVVAGRTIPDLLDGASFGAALVYELDGAWSDLGSGLAGATGVPSLKGAGTLLAGTAGALTLAGAAPSAPSLLFVSFASNPVAFKSGVLVPVPFAFALALSTSGAGGWSLPWAAWPAGLPAGAELFFQVGVSDPGAPQGVALSNARRAVAP